MKKEDILFEMFDSIETIEPSAEWHDKLTYKIAHSRKKSENLIANRFVLIILVALVTFNMFAFSANRKQINEHRFSNRLSQIAKELLINTNSSKY